MTEIFNLVGQFFDPIILVLIAVSGYLTFLLFFYGSDHWGNLEWGDRILVGFILGMGIFLCISWIPNTINYWLILMRDTPMKFNDVSAILMGSYIFLILLLCLLRSKSNTFLHNSSVSKHWEEVFERVKLSHLIELGTFLISFVILVKLQYPFSDYLVTRWIVFNSVLMLGIIVVYAALPTILSNLTYMPEVKLDILSNFFDNLEKIKINKKLLLQISIHFALIIMVAFTITSADSQFGLFTPKITLVESFDVIDQELTITRYGNGETILSSSNSRTYHLMPPLIPFVSITYLQIKNPSNLIDATTQYEPEITTSDGLECYLSPDNKNLNMTINTTKQTDLSATVEYNNILETAKMVEIWEQYDIAIIELSNGSKQRDYKINLKNISPYSLELESFTIVELPYFHNVTSFKSSINWSPERGGYCSIDQSGSKFHARGRLDSGISVNIELNIVYEET